MAISQEGSVLPGTNFCSTISPIKEDTASKRSVRFELKGVPAISNFTVEVSYLKCLRLAALLIFIKKQIEDGGAKRRNHLTFISRSQKFMGKFPCRKQRSSQVM